MTFFVIRMPPIITELAALSTDIVGAQMLIAELGVRAAVPALEEMRLVHTHPTASVEVRMAASSAIPPAPCTQELAALRMDGVATHLLTVGMAASPGAMAQLVGQGAVPERPPPLQRPLEPKNRFWARHQPRLRMAAIQLMVHAVLETETLFAAIGQMEVAVHFMGYLIHSNVITFATLTSRSFAETRPLIAARDVNPGHVLGRQQSQYRARQLLRRLQIQVLSTLLVKLAYQLCMQA